MGSGSIIGGASGAALGGIAGSALGPPGTIIGGTIGGLAGRAIGSSLDRYGDINGVKRPMTPAEQQALAQTQAHNSNDPFGGLSRLQGIGAPQQQAAPNAAMEAARQAAAAAPRSAAAMALARQTQVMRPGITPDSLTVGGASAPAPAPVAPPPATFQVPDYSQKQQQFGNAALAAQARSAPQMNQAIADQARNSQSGLINQLTQEANGQGSSAAQLQMQQGYQQQIAAAQAQAASARGGVNPALLQRQLMDEQANGLQNVNAQSGILRAQEQAAAQGQLGQQLGMQRGQDIGIAGANQQASLQGQAQNDQLVTMYTNAGMSLDQAQLQAAMERSRQQQAGWMHQGQLGLGQGQLAAQTAYQQGQLALGQTQAQNQVDQFGQSLGTQYLGAATSAGGAALAAYLAHRPTSPAAATGAPELPATSADIVGENIDPSAVEMA